MKNINFYISSKVKEKFPDLDEVVMPVYGVNVHSDESIISASDFEKFLSGVSDEEFYNQKDLINFRNFCGELNIDLKKYPPSVEFLFKRFQKNGKVPHVNNVVDCANKIAVETFVATGVFDLDKIKGDLILRFSKDNEEFKPLGGDTEYLPEGMVVIADDEKILNLFPFRDSIYQKITNETKNILILADKMPKEDLNRVKEAVIKVGKLVEEKCGGKTGELSVFEAQSVRLDPIFDKNQVSQNKAQMRVLSGITPSGNTLHIGNYAGAVKPQFELLEKGVESYYFVADLHALTTIQNKEKLENCIINNVFDYIALGLDPEKGAYFRQSDIPEHSMLAIVLANYIPFGLTNRMHAFKDKLAKGISTDEINMGLFNYPILMAADILLYKPYGVPVGEDQRQHIEFARETARYFNTAHGNVFPIPKPLIPSGTTGRVIGTDGERKMGKSLGNVVNIFDDEVTIKRQIMGCFTDPNRKHATDPGRVEGNPIFIYHDIINDDKEEVEDLKKRYREGKVGDVEVKQKLLDAHLKKFGEARKRRKDLQNDIKLAKKILENGAERARKIAKETIKEVYEVVGIKNKLN